jgi:hypothetical protein
MASHEAIMNMLQRNANYNDFSGSTMGSGLDIFKNIRSMKKKKAMGSGYVGGKRGVVNRCPRGMRRKCIKGSGYVGGEGYGYVGGCAGCGSNCMHCGAGAVGGMDGMGYVGGFKGEQLLRKKYLAKYPNDKKKRDRLFKAYLKRHPEYQEQYAVELDHRVAAAHKRKGVKRGAKVLKVKKVRVKKVKAQRAPRSGENYIQWRAGFIKKWKAYNTSTGLGPDKETIAQYWANHKDQRFEKLTPAQKKVLEGKSFAEPFIGWGY